LQKRAVRTKIAKTRYNRRYKELRLKGRRPKYLKKGEYQRFEKGGKGDEVRALIKLRCENWEQKNKYWLDEKYWKCIFSEEGMDCIKDLVLECKKTKDWFIELGKDKDKIIERIWDEDLENSKGGY